MDDNMWILALRAIGRGSMEMFGDVLVVLMVMFGAGLAGLITITLAKNFGVL